LILPQQAEGRPMQALSPEKIQVRAYELWEQDGRPDGKADEYWYRAATELANDNGVAKKPRKKAAAATATAAPVTKAKAAAPVAKKKAAAAAPVGPAAKAKKKTAKKAN
jgi:hypothetical protein